MKYLFATLAFVTAALGGRIVPRSTDMEEYRKYMGEASNTGVGPENARVFSQEDQHFPAKYYYPTYPDYVDYRYSGKYNGQMVQAPPRQEISSWSSVWTRLIPITSFALIYGAKAGFYFFSVFLILIVGVIFTTSICTFTPICTIAFPAFALTQNQVKEQVAELARSYITPESLTAATIYVQDAVDKFAQLQAEEDDKGDMDNQPLLTKRPSSSVEPTSTMSPSSSELPV